MYPDPLGAPSSFVSVQIENAALDDFDPASCQLAYVPPPPGAGDDLSHVRLLNYPCVVEEAPAKVYNGHSSHVTNIRFSSDDTWVCSVGSRDRAVLQWRTRGIKPGEAPPEEKEEVEEEKVWGALDETGKNFGWVRPPKQQPSAQKGA